MYIINCCFFNFKDHTNGSTSKGLLSSKKDEQTQNHTNGTKNHTNENTVSEIIKPVSQHQHQNGSNGSSHASDTNQQHQQEIDKLLRIITSLQDEVHTLKDLVKKHESRIVKLENEKNNVDVNDDELVDD